MGIKSRIFGFFKGIFLRFIPRAGFDRFAANYEKLAYNIVKDFIKVRNGESLRLWQDEAWESIKGQVQRDGNIVKGTWVSMLVLAAYETIQAEIEKR